MKDHLPLAELKRLVRAEKNANWAKRLRIVILGVEGWTAPVAAMAVGSPRRICQRWVRPDNEEGKDVQRILVEEFHVFRALSSVYGLLHRRGSSYLRPRPRQRKADPEKQAAILAAWPERLRAIAESRMHLVAPGPKLGIHRIPVSQVAGSAACRRRVARPSL